MVLVALVALVEFSRYIFDKVKFGKRSSYHMYSAKLCGVLLFIGSLELFYRGYVGAFGIAALLVGIIAVSESFMASVVLSAWRTDVPSLVHAVRLERRNEDRAGESGV